MRERLTDAFHVVRFFATVLLPIVAGVAWLFRAFGVTWEQWRPLEYLCTIPLLALVLFYLPSIIRRVRKRSEIVEETTAIDAPVELFSSFSDDKDLLQEIQTLENPCSGERKAGFELAKQIISTIIRERR